MAFIGGGCKNSTCATFTTIVGGYLNCSRGCRSFIGGGCSNCNCAGDESVIVGGRLNRSCCFGFIGGGCNNISSSNYGAVVGGKSNSSSYVSFVGGGFNNSASGNFSGILGGCSNNTGGCSEAMIVGSCIVSQLSCATSVNKLIYYASATDTNYLTDPNVAGEIVFFGTFRETVAAGQLVVFTNNGTIGWHLADADTTTESTGLLGISLSSRSDGNNNATGVLVRGFARSSTYYTTAGDSDILYVSNTPGGITDTAPTGSGDVVRIVGYMVDDTFDLIYFCPDTTWVQLV